MPEILEHERLEAVNRFLLLDYDKSNEFQDIVNFAAELCGTPVALITLLDKEVNWVKVRTGIDAPAMPRETSFCQYTIQNDSLTIIPDALEDSRFDNNPLVHEPPNVRFYAGAPLTLKNGLRMGSLCLFDGKPNNISTMQQKALTVMARQVTFLMELELSYQVLAENLKTLEEKNESLKNIAHMQSHDIRQPLTSIMGLINIIKDDNYIADKEKLILLEEAATDLDNKIHSIVEETGVNR
ncbi:MAG: GAF domain-containing protein [Chitinophagaceae bacterium]|nr:GAF domain-containing protein [Chitinophagaceae bacterium]MCB9045130.1 GAF domain-containing protein [Chitinophagales bacterium]